MKPSKPILNCLTQDKRLKLRKDVYHRLTEQEWVFNRLENDRIFLIHASGAYGMAVRIENIDWSEFQTE